MLHLGANRTRNKVNVLKKVKVDGQWKFCPAVVETDGRLKERVRVNGRTEVHSEGVYYIEWREGGQRLRQSVPNRNHVLEVEPPQREQKTYDEYRLVLHKFRDTCGKRGLQSFNAF